MNWTSVLDEIKGFVSGEKLTDVLTWVDKAKGAFEQGTLVAGDIVSAAKYFSDQYEAIKSTDFKKLATSVITGNGQADYANLVAGLTFDQLMEFHRSSIEQLRGSSERKLRELEVLRSLIELPARIMKIVAVVI